MSFSNYLAAAVLDYIFSKTSDIDTQPTIYLALSSSTPTETGTNVTEPDSADGYSRLVTAASDWNQATEADPASLTNATDLEFGTATDDWLSQANMTYAVLYDSLDDTGSNNMLAFGALTTAKPVLDGDTPRFTAGDIQITLD